ncbi:MAG: hypothetical protein Q4F15_03900 [Bacillota bacterium]|nr:hypothetical protein [Bacillota bacterium]
MEKETIRKGAASRFIYMSLISGILGLFIALCLFGSISSGNLPLGLVCLSLFGTSLLLEGVDLLAGYLFPYWKGRKFFAPFAFAVAMGGCLFGFIYSFTSLSGWTSFLSLGCLLGFFSALSHFRRSLYDFRIIKSEEVYAGYAYSRQENGGNPDSKYSFDVSEAIEVEVEDVIDS